MDNNDNNDLAILEKLFRDIASDQREYIRRYEATTLLAGVDFIRGHATAFEKAADIVAERAALRTLNNQES